MERRAVVSGAATTRAEVALIPADDPSIGSQFALAGRDASWLELLFSRPARQLASNVRTAWALARVGDVVLPTTINDTEYENSYVCSPYSGCILYPRSELDKLRGRRLLTAALRALLFGMALPLRAASINRIVCVNNWMLSTNLYPAWEGEHAAELTRLLVARYPTHAIAFRSLNETTNGPLLRRLEAAGYLLAPSRQVYFVDGASSEFKRKQDTQRDRALLKQTTYRVVTHDEFTGDDTPRIEHLYRLLYIDKYSPYNPQFTVEMLEECRRRGILRFQGLRTPDGRLDGIVGSFERAGVMTVPIVGYDTNLPQSLGLYRLLTALVMCEAAERKLLMNMSSGAAEFKRLRGARPELEYTAVYCRHLSAPRRAVWHTLAWLLRNVGAPVLRKYKL